MISAARLVFLGPPGSGKGTQSRRMQELFGIPALSSGDTLRGEVARGSDVGRRARRYMESGGLVPDEVITQVMMAGIDALPSGSGFILDGFPRTAPQADALSSGLVGGRGELNAVIDFLLDDAEIVRRIVPRRVCEKCGQMYNVEFLPPRVADVCDRCGGKLIRRPDDREDVVRTRIATYRAQTAPLIAYYEQRGLLRKVSAAAGAGTVESAVSEIIQSIGTQG